MDEKTEELRDIFLETADEETVTESQADAPGSLTADEAEADERIRAVVASMREQFEFATDLPDERLVSVVRGFYTGRGDEELASELDRSTEEVFRARLDLHLVRPSDTDVPLDRLRSLGDHSAAEAAAELGVSEAALARARAVLAAEREASQVSNRFRATFEDALPTAVLSERLAATAREDGLREAAEDIETDVQF